MSTTFLSISSLSRKIIFSNFRGRRPSPLVALPSQMLTSLGIINATQARKFSETGDGRRSDGASSADEATGEDLSMWDTPDLRRIFENNRKWQRKKLAEDPEYFNKLYKGQQPDFLLIGCADSRVGAQEIMGMNQGELFVHRNIANMVVPTDMSMLSVLFYAVNVLRVKDILVLGHYECGGVRAASANQDLGLIEHWLRNIRDVQRLHNKELSAITDTEKRHRRLVELNVQEQCFNLFGNSIVQQMQAKTGRPRIHGFVYDIKNGLLKHLDIDWKSVVREYRDIYTVADFRHYAPLDINNVLQDNSGGDDEAPHAKEIVQEPHDSSTDRLVVVRHTVGQANPRPLRCRSSTTISELKHAIQALDGTPVEQQVLLHDGAQLKHDNDTLAAVGISDIAEVTLKVEVVPSAFKPPSP